jgi:glucose-6-phosphate 1-dehydrogenase
MRGPDIAIGLGLRGKLPGERMVGRDVELMLNEQADTEMPPYQRLLGDAFAGNEDLFARQDFVDAQWRVVDRTTFLLELRQNRSSDSNRH